MNKRTLRVLLIVGLIALAGAAYLYWAIFQQTHRDVQQAAVDEVVSATELVKYYLHDASGADQHYLSDNGESAVLVVQGVVTDIQTDLEGRTVILLQEQDQPAGVSCTFLEGLNEEDLRVGQSVQVKGVIRSGARYDEDLEFYEHVILNQCALYQEHE